MRRALILLLLIASGCSMDADVARTEPATLLVTTAAGTVELSVEVADTPEERATGLMHRKELAPFDGMAFVWTEPTTATFWMKSTLIPLSIAFWNRDGRIVAMLDMEPCEAEPCPAYGVGRTSVGAIEVAQGGFEERGIAIGDRVELAASQT